MGQLIFRRNLPVIANRWAIKTQRLHATLGVQDLGVQDRASSVNFATDAIEMGAAAGTRQFIVKTSLGSEGGVRVQSELEISPVPNLSLSTGVSGSLGYGASYSGARLMVWGRHKELFPIVLACFVWGDQWRNRRIQFCCDNQSVWSL